MLTSSIGNGHIGYYNAQDIGIAKSLSKFADEIIVYRLVSNDRKIQKELISDCKNTTLMFLPSKKIGSNGLVDVNILDSSLDILIYFADTQLSLPRVSKWCNQNEIILYPYIGILRSHHSSKIVRYVMNQLFLRNIEIYRTCHCFAKTPQIKKELVELGVQQITVVPVGLDTSLLKADFVDYDLMEMKDKYNYNEDDKIVLFIGRLTNEKQPLLMIDIFAQLVKYDKCYKLLMVGTGKLRSKIIRKLEESSIEQYVQLIDSVPNCDMWELYRFVEVIVNLNQQEIFGMAILEAMYYGCKVVAWSAPGPSLIIEDGISGFLVNSNKEAVEQIINGVIDTAAAHNRIVESFTWERSVQVLLSAIDNKQ